MMHSWATGEGLKSAFTAPAGRTPARVKQLIDNNKPTWHGLERSFVTSCDLFNPIGSTTKTRLTRREGKYHTGMAVLSYFPLFSNDKPNLRFIPLPFLYFFCLSLNSLLILLSFIIDSILFVSFFFLVFLCYTSKLGVRVCVALTNNISNSCWKRERGQSQLRWQTLTGVCILSSNHMIDSQCIRR